MSFLRYLIKEFIRGLTTITEEEKEVLKMLGEFRLKKIPIKIQKNLTRLI